MRTIAGGITVEHSNIPPMRPFKNGLHNRAEALRLILRLICVLDVQQGEQLGRVYAAGRQNRHAFGHALDAGLVLVVVTLALLQEGSNGVAPGVRAGLIRLPFGCDRP